MNNPITISVECRNCRRTVRLTVDHADWDEWNSPNRRHVQEVFPYLTASEREMFLSRICGECWDEIFGM